MVVLKADSGLLTFTDRQSVPDTDWNYLHDYFCKMREKILYDGKVWYKEVVKWILSNLSDTYNSSCFSLQSYRFAVYMVVADIDCLSCGSRNNFLMLCRDGYVIICYCVIIIVNYKNDFNM